MIEPITIEKIKLAGFRAYLEPQEIILNKKRSLAILAKNGLGKSSLVDSLEYYFDKDGTLDMLGKKKGETKAGPAAIQHVDAEKRTISTFVHIWFNQGAKPLDDDLRQFKAPLTGAARKVLDIARVPFVIRGYNLHRFINEPKGTDRYEMLVEWLNLSPLYTIQDNLHAMKRKMKEIVDDTSDVDERSHDIARETAGSVSSFDEQKILDWLNVSVLAALDDSLQLRSLSDEDPIFQELERRGKEERRGSGIDVLEKLADSINRLYRPPATSQEMPSGLIVLFNNAVLEFKDATKRLKIIGDADSESVFDSIWQSAKSLLDNDNKIYKCLVCCTKFTSSPLKSRENVYEKLHTNISKLKEYHKAENIKNKTKDNLVQAERNLDKELDLLSSLSGSKHQRADISDYYKVLKSWKAGEDAPDSEFATNELMRLHSLVSADIGRIEQQRGGHTYGDALDKIRRLLGIASEFKRIEHTKVMKKAILDNLELQADEFSKIIVAHVGNLLDALQAETNRLYKEIRGPHEEKREIHIKLADKDTAKQRFAQLLIDFRDSHKKVVPGSYLSESQTYTLALALHLAAIRKFNKEVRIIALDDIILSQDEDRRSNIAAVLTKHFHDFQVIITTQDKFFYKQLKERLPPDLWQFKEIVELRGGFGPIFDDHKTRDEVVETNLAAGKDAGTDMRKAEEEWLEDICLDFRTSVDFTKAPLTTHPLAKSLYKFLKDKNLKPPKIDGNANPFIFSLQSNVVENISSHFDSNYDVSIGDQQRRWDEFKEFRSLFMCTECDHTRFERPKEFKKPICRHCKTEFSFEH